MRIRVSDCQLMTIDEIRVGKYNYSIVITFAVHYFSRPAVYNKYYFRFTVKRSKKCAWNFITTRTLQYNNNWSRSDVCVYAGCAVCTEQYIYRSSSSCRLKYVIFRNEKKIIHYIIIIFYNH